MLDLIQKYRDKFLEEGVLQWRSRASEAMCQQISLWPIKDFE